MFTYQKVKKLHGIIWEKILLLFFRQTLYFTKYSRVYLQKSEKIKWNDLGKNIVSIFSTNPVFDEM